MQYDVIVLGAGIVGLSTALQLQERRQTVVLLDKGDAGEETSFGNAGIISTDPVPLISSHLKLRHVPRQLSNRTTYVRFYYSYLLETLPWLTRAVLATRPGRIAIIAKAMQSLMTSCRAEHARFAGAAGAETLFRNTGWLTIYRTKKDFEASAGHLALAGKYGLCFEKLIRGEIVELEPHLSDAAAYGVLKTDASSVTDPGKLCKLYARLFAKRGGVVARGDAMGLTRSSENWSVQTFSGRSSFRLEVFR